MQHGAITLNFVHKGKELEPYVVLDADGNIDDQEHWKGEPTKLVGFVKELPYKTLDVDYQTFWSNAYMAVGKYPVFADAQNEWFAEKHQVTSVDIAEK